MVDFEFNIKPNHRETVLIEKLLANKQLASAARSIKPGKTLTLSGVWGSSASLIAATLAKLKNAPLLMLTSHLSDADDTVDDLELFTGRVTQLIPAWEADLGGQYVNDEITVERVQLCNNFAKKLSGQERLQLVAPILAILQTVPSPEVLAAGKLAIVQGATIDPGDLASWLFDAGYEKVDQVDQQGQYAKRGGILDVLAPGGNFAFRIEFFGDVIDSIRRVDLDTQRSAGSIDSCELISLTAGHVSDDSDAVCLLDYLPKETIICITEPKEVFDLVRQIHSRLIEMSSSIHGTGLMNPEMLIKRIKSQSIVELVKFSTSTTASAAGKNRDLAIRSLETLSANTGDAMAELTELSATAEVRVYCENQSERERFGQLIDSREVAYANEITCKIGHVASGFYWPGEHLVVVGHHEIFHRYSKLRRVRKIRPGRPIESLLDLQDGDYVVHISYGIAKFIGLRMLERDGTKEEYLTLQFAGKTLMHVPASSIDLVQKYVGSGGRRPVLSPLGGSRWSKRKEAVAEAVKDLASEMLRLQAMRKQIKGVAYPLDTDWQRQFAGEFAYSETPDQITTIEQIDSDLSSAIPMDRLLCGDVGYGKTELAMRAAFKVAEAGKQVAILVPTTVLAAQHYRTFTERFADYPFNIDLLCRFRTPKQQRLTITAIGKGKVDIVIGTHRLLSKDVVFGDLGLAIIDEEQRFGVEHKDHLKAMRASVDVLTMTATPIPRTMHLALLGLRDISSLATPPMDRRAIHTEVCTYDDQLIRKAILRELNRNGQVFFVHNRVDDIEILANHIRSLAGGAKVAVGHGQMPDGELENIMRKFIDGKIDVLVSTTIIESGLDIPSANTMIVHDADRFGLAQLHQLRGRIGRYKHHAYCYLLLPERRGVTPVAARRLKAIEDFSDLGAGFQIAMRDLEIRGAGNILGREQSGHIASVGYELYCQLVERAVKVLRGEKPTRPPGRVHVALGINDYIPLAYIPSSRQRMEIYRRIASCYEISNLTQLTADLTDAFGPIGPSMKTLLDQTKLRILAGELGISSIILFGPDIIFTVTDPKKLKDVFTTAAGSVRMPDDKTIHWRPPPVYREMPSLLTILLKRLGHASS